MALVWTIANLTIDSKRGLDMGLNLVNRDRCYLRSADVEQGAMLSALGYCGLTWLSLQKH